jgi:hypothetical protein
MSPVLQMKVSSVGYGIAPFEIVLLESKQNE